MLKVAGNKSVQDEGDGRSLLDEIAREGARRMLLAALETEVAGYLEAHRDERDGDGHALVVATAVGALDGLPLEDVWHRTRDVSNESFRILQQCGVHMVPRLSARREDVHRWSMPARVVQAGRVDDEHRISGLRCHDGRTAFCAETPAAAAATVCCRDVILWSALCKSERACGNEYSRRVRRSASSLTVSAMTV